MKFKVDECKILDYAISKLPNVNSFEGKIVVVWVNDFIGETGLINESRFSSIYLPSGELMVIDRKDKEYFYKVIFQKIKEKDNYVWDLVGYDKLEIKDNIYGFDVDNVDDNF